MELQDIAAIAEIIGVIMIVITFLFLGMQIRESNRATRASVSQSISSSEIHYVSQLLKYADTWEKVLSEQAIDDPVERRRAVQLFTLVLVGLENRYHQFRLGYMDSETWNGQEPAIKLLVNLAIYDDWQLVPGYYTRTGGFRQYLESLRG